jgi:hypothetical protein
LGPAFGLVSGSITIAGVIDYPEFAGDWLGSVTGVLVSTLAKNLLAGNKP